MARGRAGGRIGIDAGVRRQRQYWWRRNASRTIGRPWPERRYDHNWRQRGQPEQRHDIGWPECHLREQQRHCSRDGFGSTPRAHGLSRHQSGWDHWEWGDEAHGRVYHGPDVRLPRSHSGHQRQSEGDYHDPITTNPKIQVPTSRTPNVQTPIALGFGSAWRLVWDLGFGRALGFGPWSLGFDAIGINRTVSRGSLLHVVGASREIPWLSGAGRPGCRRKKPQ